MPVAHMVAIAAAALVPLSLATVGVMAMTGDEAVRVVRVVDGDTLDVRRAGTTVRLRLLNIDTPETVDPRRPVECLGPEASRFLKTLLPVGTEVRLAHDRVRFDRYDRELAGVFLGDSLVNAEIARAGLGRAVRYGQNARFYDEVRRAEATARHVGSGIHAEDVACTLLPAVEELASDVAALAPPPDGSDDAAYTAQANKIRAQRLRLLDLRRSFWRGLESWPLNALPEADERLLRLHTLERELDDGYSALTQAHGRERTRREEARRAAAEAARLAEQERARQEAEQRARERAEQRAQARAERAAAERRRAAGASGGRSKTGGSAGRPAPYTGCRSYAPGGKTYKPIPCPGR